MEKTKVSIIRNRGYEIGKDAVGYIDGYVSCPKSIWAIVVFGENIVSVTISNLKVIQP